MIEQVQGQASPKIDYNSQIRQIIQKISLNGSYQIKLIVFFMFVSLFTNFEFFSSQYLYMNPSFYCRDNMEYKVKEIDACDFLQFCTLAQSGTLTAHLNLYCGSKKEDRVFIQSSSSFGNLAGIIFAFMVSDKKGKKFSICLCLILINLGCILQFIGIKHQISDLLWISQVIYGFCGKIIYVNFLIICTRFLRKSWYEWMSVGWFFTSASSTIIISSINLIFHDWRILFGLYSIGLIIIAILSLLILLEDPIYYLDSGQYEQCKKVIEDISCRNGTDNVILMQNLTQIDKLIKSKTGSEDTNKQKEKHFDYFKLLDCRIIQSAIILGILGMFSMMFGSSLDFSLPNLQLDYNYNLIIKGLSNMIGNFTSGLLIRTEISRKTCFLLASVICSCAGLFFGFKSFTENSFIQVFLITSLRITLCWTSAFLVRMKVDLFPEKYQATILAFIQLLSNCGKILGPYATEFSNDRNLSAIFTVAILHSTIGTIPIFFLLQKKIELCDESLPKKEIGK